MHQQAFSLILRGNDRQFAMAFISKWISARWIIACRRRRILTIIAANY